MARDFKGLDSSGLSRLLSKLKEKIDAKSKVSVTQIQSSGTKIGSITVDGKTTDLYVPGSSSGSNITLSNLLAPGVYIGQITIDGVSTNIYAPTPRPDLMYHTNISSSTTTGHYQLLFSDNNVYSASPQQLSYIYQSRYCQIYGSAAGHVRALGGFSMSTGSSNIGNDKRPRISSNKLLRQKQSNQYHSIYFVRKKITVAHNDRSYYSAYKVSYRSKRSFPFLFQTAGQDTTYK